LINGRPARMSRDYIAYLKGLFVTNCFWLFLFWDAFYFVPALLCSLFVVFFLQLLFVGGCISVVLNIHVLIARLFLV
jgi:hypothetical protein